MQFYWQQLGFMLRLVLNTVYCRDMQYPDMHVTYLDSLESESYQLAKSQLIQIKFHQTSFNKQSQISHFKDDSYSYLLASDWSDMFF